ncbi:hypothetical protein PV328_004750 [Microctonus aethiopoides]|uniref:Uncharacterized protein n=1 Tax=Microctonus aethiopoides TaxID=144406 RepID=A0AA39KM18_9HYME|nr:hypothetical protein PV328_004750 [Microctonus aethiopoides]
MWKDITNGRGLIDDEVVEEDKNIILKMPMAEALEPALVEDVGQLEHLDEPPGRARGQRNVGGDGANNNNVGGGNQGARAGLMKPLVVLALPGMYLFYKYSQYRREQRELSRRRITERELQHLHHKI